MTTTLTLVALTAIAIPPRVAALGSLAHPRLAIQISPVRSPRTGVFLSKAGRSDAELAVAIRRQKSGA
jgi:hypothetical protein